MSLPHDIESELLELPLARRTQLVVKLLDSIDSRCVADVVPVQRAWLEESSRRYEAFVRGEETSVSASLAMAQIVDPNF